MNCDKILLSAKTIFLASLISFSGCDSTESTLGGGAIGTALGAAVGYAAGGSGGAVAGGAVGGLGGAALGHHVAKQNEPKNTQVVRYVEQPVRKNSYKSNDICDEYELRAMRNEVERQRLLNEKLLLEKERQEIIGK